MIYSLCFIISTVKVIYTDLIPETESQTTLQLGEGNVLNAKQNKSETTLDQEVVMNEWNEYNEPEGKSDEKLMVDDEYGYFKVKQHSKAFMKKDEIDLLIKQQSIRYKAESNQT